MDGPADSDEVVCMFDGTGADMSGYRYSAPFVWGETVSFESARAVRCIAFYYKGGGGDVGGR